MTPPELLAPPVPTHTAPPADRPEATDRPGSPRRVAAARVVIATDGSRAADAALWFGNALAQRDRTDALILTVYEPLPTYDPAATVAAGHAELEHVLAQDLQDSIEQQLRRTTLDVSPWRTRFEAGPPAPTICRVAAEQGASLIVLGLGRHGPVERALGKEMGLQVMRLSEVPVLAVARSTKRLPRRAAVAVDFSESSRRAAHAALRVIGDRGALYLVHVMPRLAAPFTATGGWEADYRRRAAADLASLARELDATQDVHVEPILLQGDPARELLAFAAADELELLVSGSHGHSALARTIVGSVSTRLVRGAHCSVLVMPPAKPSVVA